MLAIASLSGDFQGTPTNSEGKSLLLQKNLLAPLSLALLLRSAVLMCMRQLQLLRSAWLSGSSPMKACRIRTSAAAESAPISNSDQTFFLSFWALDPPYEAIFFPTWGCDQKGLSPEFRATRLSRRKKKGPLWRFSAYFPVSQAEKGAKRICTKPVTSDTRVSLVKVKSPAHYKRGSSIRQR